MTNQNPNNPIRKRIYQQFIKPMKGENDYIGIELEMPIVNLEKKAVDFQIIHQITRKFKKEFPDFTKASKDYDGNIYALQNPKTHDILCYDCSYNNIEFAMGPEEDINTIDERFNQYYTYIKQSLEKYNHTITGMGINPYRKYNNEIPIPSERYLMLYHHLESYRNYRNPPIKFHKYPGYGMFSSASQVQLDVQQDELISSINTFTKIEPIKALLFSNSLLYGEDHNITCYRDLLWEYSTHGINPRNIGMYDKQLSDINDLLSYMQSLNMYCVMRDKSYINFPSISLDEYYSKENITGEIYDNGSYEKIDITPTLDDIDYLRPFKFINLTNRGTIEFRSICTQPVSESMSVAAFHRGLKDKLYELNQLITESDLYGEYSPTQLRKLLIQYEIPEYLDKAQLYSFAKEIVDLAADGMKERGLDEEKYLKPLYERIRKQTNPSKNIIDSLNSNKTIEDLIKEYG
ncbi:MAG: hypothetical protein J6S29_04500 [Methanosphaera sp.]|nr:hypothetical protein [Methanosphaera sp.]